jgi:hypothetical protein
MNKRQRKKLIKRTVLAWTHTEECAALGFTFDGKYGRNQIARFCASNPSKMRAHACHIHPAIVLGLALRFTVEAVARMMAQVFRMAAEQVKFPSGAVTEK